MLRGLFFSLLGAFLIVSFQNCENVDFQTAEGLPTTGYDSPPTDPMDTSELINADPTIEDILDEDGEVFEEIENVVEEAYGCDEDSVMVCHQPDHDSSQRLTLCVKKTALPDLDECNEDLEDDLSFEDLIDEMRAWLMS